MKTQSLICQHDGHTWERPSQRGRKPLLCPEHAGQEAVVKPRPAAATGTHDALIDRALGALDTIHDPETIRTIDYILTQLSSGLREEADQNLLAGTLVRILR